MSLTDKSETVTPILPPLMNDVGEYVKDAWQRSILYADVMRQRGNQYQRHIAKKAPHVLSMKAEVVMVGHDLPRPVNYVLARITPPESSPIDLLKRPFVVVDPRAGHGPGIAGFKADSEIGVAVQAGHPCYFIGFLPNPEPDQTVEDVIEAEARFLEEVISLHPQAEGLPVVIGNCQAGWQIMMTAALRPELFGPIIIAGAPLSYWAGWRDTNPMRYTGGITGGSWMTMLASDLGNGKFDGANLVQNFENLNPGNTHWAKQYNLYANVDTEAKRYLEFEKWWGGHVYLNGQEIQYIVDNLFIGNKLATAELVTKSGTRIDLRNIRSPIIVFCSKGDNITPPPQALGWIADLYQNDNDIVAHGQTIIYSVHESIGHLGIFVSGAVANKEHREFATNIDMIDVLPPGLYEINIKDKTPETLNADLAEGNYVTSFEHRTLEDINKIVEHKTEDDRRFAAVSRVSDINVGLYKSFVQPWLKMMVTPASAEFLQKTHKLRMPYELISDKTKAVAAVAPLAVEVRNHREPVRPDNPFLLLEKQMSTAIENTLNQWGEMRDKWSEKFFMSFYGSSLVQDLVGLGAKEGAPRRHPGVSPEQRAFVTKRIGELQALIPCGGVREACVRMLMYVSQAQGGIDERSYALIRRMRASRDDKMPLGEFKQMVREQALIMTLDSSAAIAALPKLLESSTPGFIRIVARFMTRVVSVDGALNVTGLARLSEIQDIFEAAAVRGAANAAPTNAGSTASEQSAMAAITRQAADQPNAPPARKALAAKPAAAVEATASVSQAKPVKKATPVKATAPAKKATPVTATAPAKKATPVKATAPVKKAAPTKQATPVRNTADKTPVAVSKPVVAPVPAATSNPAVAKKPARKRTPAA